MFVPDYQKLVYNLLTVTVPVFTYLWNNKRKAKRDNDRRHAETQRTCEKILKDIAAEHKFLPPHRHSETEGMLHVRGIISAPRPDGH